MLKFFADDSGSHTNSNGYFVLYGYLMEELRWEDFAERWDAQLRRPDFYPLPYCHMIEAWPGEGVFVGIKEEFRKRKVMDLAEVIRDCQPTAIGCRMPWERYNRIVKGKVARHLDNPYAVLFFSILRGIVYLQEQIVENMTAKDKEQALREHAAVVAVKPVDFVFDEQGEAGRQCLRWYGELQSRLSGHSRTVLSNTPQFKDDRDVNPLQAADMLAWHVRRQWDYHLEDHSHMLDLLIPFGVLEREIDEYTLNLYVETFRNG